MLFYIQEISKMFHLNFGHCIEGVGNFHASISWCSYFGVYKIYITSVIIKGGFRVKQGGSVDPPEF
jgi:hypothetical protein